MNKTKIIATVNDGTEDEVFLEGLYDAGVRIIRFNFSHGEHEKVARVLGLIRNIASRGKHLSTLLDTKGIEIRTGKISEKKQFRKGDQFPLISSTPAGEYNGLTIDYPYIHEDVTIGGRIEIDSGAFPVRVIAINGEEVIVEAEADALIGSNRHVNLPGVSLRLPSLTQKDSSDLLFAIEQKMNFVAASFVRNASNVEDIRNYLRQNGGEHITIISKIENQEAIENLDEIIQSSDGVMVARGDLGIEVPMVSLPMHQRNIVKKCREQGKFVIVATHMLKSMTDSPTPSRAEISDVFNAVMQKADLTMLSEETAIGLYPIASVQAMAAITREAEQSLEYGHPDYTSANISERDKEKKYLIRSAIKLSEDLNITTIILFTKTGRLARFAAAYRPNTSIQAFTPTLSTLHYCNILFGIEAHVLSNWGTHEENIWGAIDMLKQNQALNAQQKVIVISDQIINQEEIPTLSIIDLTQIKK